MFGFDPDMIFRIPALLIALTVHEYAHARVAVFLGDPTPRYAGRLTLNPIPHLDPIGLLMLWIFRFGWAKPVQVNPYNFKGISIKKGMMLVSLAGPLMNVFLALVAMILYKLCLPYAQNEWVAILLQLIVPLIYINLILAAFNLIPVPPLDGSKILAGLLSDARAEFVYSLEQYGPVILLLLIATDLVGKIIWPLVNFLYRILYAVVF